MVKEVIFVSMFILTMKKDIILFGMQGCGKGTQADMLLKKFKNYQYFEPGNILRALESNDNVIGHHIRASIDQGKMVDNEIVFELFDIFGHLLKKGEAMLVDGFLRTVSQMYYFLNTEYRQRRDFVGIYYKVSKKTALKRLLGRAKLEGRKDDNAKSMSQRIAIYEKETLPVIKYFESIGKLIVVDAEGIKEKAYKETLKKLEKLS